MFQMPKRILCQESGFFEGRCNGRWPMDTGVDLTDISVLIFAVFLAWLSTGSIVNSEGNIIIPHNNGIIYGSQFTQLIHCYLLADRLLAPTFQNRIADEICLFLDDGDWAPAEETLFANMMADGLGGPE